jgi:hypothetical protein
VTGPGGWRAGELSLIDGSGEVGIATRRGDGTLRAARIVWIVRLADVMYIRSVNGTTAARYRGVQTRHQGELNAGRLRRGVAFVEAGAHADEGSGLDDALDGRLPRQVRPLVGAVSRITADVARATAPARRPRLTFHF